MPRRKPIEVISSGIGDKDLIADYLFYRLKGGDHLHDFSQEKNHGTINGPEWVSTRRGWALKFDGSDDYSKIPGDLVGNEPFTVIVWAITPVDVDGEALVAQSPADFNEDWVLDAINDTFRFFVRDTAENAYQAKGETVPNGEWFFMAGVFTGSEIRLYVDGSLVDSTSVSEVDSEATSVTIGARNEDNLAHWWPGTISHVRIYDRALSAQKISRCYSRMNV